MLELERALDPGTVQEAPVRRPLDRQGHHRVEPIQRRARLMVAVEHARDLGQRRHRAPGQDAAGDQGAGRQLAGADLVDAENDHADGHQV